MASICLENCGCDEITQVWQQVAFVEVSSTTPKIMSEWWPTLYAKLCTEVLDRYDVNHESPMQFVVFAGSSAVCETFNAFYATSELMKLAIIISECNDGNLKFNCSFAFAEFPIDINVQPQSFWLNLIVREINLMADQHHISPNRVWMLLMNEGSDDERNSEDKIRVKGFENLTPKGELYDKDGKHLSEKGYVIWLIHNMQTYCVGAEETRPSIWLDFPMIKKKVISYVDPLNGINFFNSLILQRHRVRSNTTDVRLVAELDVMELYSIDPSDMQNIISMQTNRTNGYGRDYGGGKLISKRSSYASVPYPVHNAGTSRSRNMNYRDQQQTNAGNGRGRGYRYGAP